MAVFIPFLSGIAFFYSFRYFPFTTSLFFILITGILLRKKRKPVILLIAFGALYAFLRYSPDAPPETRNKEIIVTGVFTSEAVNSTGGYLQKMKVYAGDFPPTKEDITVHCKSAFATGEGYTLRLKLKPPLQRHNPGGFKWDNIYAELIEVMDKPPPRAPGARERLNRHIIENFDKEAGSLIMAVTTGERGGMPEDLRDAFGKTGLAHLLSISGTHFGLLSAFLFLAFRTLVKSIPVRRLEKLTLYIGPSQAAVILSVPFMVFYLALSGGSIPAIRSFIMISLFLLGLIIGTKGFWLNSLVFAAFLLAFWEPSVLLDFSFQLSFLAVLFIGFFRFWPAIPDKEEQQAPEKIIPCRVKGPAKRLLIDPLILTLSASLGVTALVAYRFHYISLISPLANLIVTPLIGFLLVPLSILSSFIYILTGYFPFHTVISALSSAAAYLTRAFSSVSFSSLSVPSFPPVLIVLFYAGFLLYFVKRKKYLLPAPFVPIILYIALGLRGGAEGALSATFLDVGRADSAVVELPYGKTIVIDTGRTGRELEDYLHYRGKTEIDALVLTHPHPDHTGGAGLIIKDFIVKEIWTNAISQYPSLNEIPSKDIRQRKLQRGDIIEGRGFAIHALHPYRGFYTASGDDYTAENNSSLVLRIGAGGKVLLFAGDIEEEGAEDITHLGGWLKSDVLKAPHHGGKTSAYRPFLNAVSPGIAVISASGMPLGDMLQGLGSSTVYRTDHAGSVKITVEGGKTSVKTFGDFRLQETANLRGEIKNIKRLFTTF